MSSCDRDSLLMNMNITCIGIFALIFVSALQDTGICSSQGSYGKRPSLHIGIITCCMTVAPLHNVVFLQGSSKLNKGNRTFRCSKVLRLAHFRNLLETFACHMKVKLCISRLASELHSNMYPKGMLD